MTMTKEEVIQERKQQFFEKKNGIYRGNVICISEMEGTVIGLYKRGILLRFKGINRFLTWWEYDKAIAGELKIAMRD